MNFDETKMIIVMYAVSVSEGSSLSSFPELSQNNAIFHVDMRISSIHIKKKPNSVLVENRFHAKHPNTFLNKLSPLCSHAHTVMSLTDPYLRAILHSYTWVPKESALLYVLIQPWPWRNSKELCEVET